MNELLPILSTSAATAVIGWLFGRKKQIAEIRSIELDNADKAAKIWRDLASELKKDLLMLHEENKQMRANVKELESKVQELIAENKELKRKFQSLTTENKKLRQLIEKNEHLK